MATENYVIELAGELERLLKNYLELSGKNYQHVTSKEAAERATVGGTVGGTAGVAIPVPGGPVIGAGAGVIIALGLVLAEEIYNIHHNKKIDNANKVTHYIGTKINEELLYDAASKVIHDRENTIKNLRDDSSNHKAVAKYLAANMMAALKHSNDKTRSPLNIMADGVRYTQSNKISSHHLSMNDEHKPSVTLKEVTRARL